MSNFLCKIILFRICYVRTLPSISKNLDPFPLRLFSSSSNQHCFTVSYLISSLGFSPQSALSASKHVKFQSSEKPDKVINLLKKYGFTQTQISRLVRKSPRILILDAGKIILPKLEFFEAKGISAPELARMLSAHPTLLRTSLANQIMPSYDYMRNLFQSDEKLIIAIKRCPDILVHNIEKYVSPNVDVLREHGMPDFRIVTLMDYYPRTFSAPPCHFRKIVEKVVDMGFDASTVTFVVAMNVLRWMGKSRWESNFDAYKKWGLSEEEVLKAFRKCPWFMALSEVKLKKCMDFFVNQMGWKPCLIAEYPVILTLSLKKRVIPRCSVFQVLLSKGLVEKEASLHSLLMVSEEWFLQNFVMPYEEELPELLKLYEEKVDLSKRV